MKLKKFLVTLSTFALLFSGTSNTANAANNRDLNSLFVVDCHAEKKFGLYSYYLFYQQPVYNAHETALKQTEFLLRKVAKIKKLYAETPASTQHGFYIPVSFKPQSWVLQPTDNDFPAAARWVLHNYDYQCAQKLLKPFPSTHDKGPYFLSSLEKLPVNPIPGIPWRTPVLIQDLSDSDNNKSIYWMTTFFKKSWQPRQWHMSDITLLQENMLEELSTHDIQEAEQKSTPLQNGLPPVSSSQSETRLTEGIATQIDPDSINPLASEKFDFNQQYPVNKTPTTRPNPYAKKVTIKFARELPE